jgi:hypothetical protein
MLFKNGSIIVLAMAIGFSFKFSTANAEEKNISKLIPNASEVTSATIVLTPPGLMTRAPLTEKKLLEFGCNHTENREEIDRLIDIVKSNLKDDNGEAGKFYLRNAVYLHLKNGSNVKYTFSGEINKNRQIYGGADNDNAGHNTPFLAQGEFLTALRKWLLDGSIEKKDAKWCLGNK